MANQRGGVPRYAANAGRLLRRSSFLLPATQDPAQPQPMWAFYGPGQGDPAQFSQAPWNYNSPTDWPYAGAILRAPRIVNLNAASFFSQSNAQIAVKPNPPVNPPLGQLAVQYVSNSDLQEYTRLLDVFNQVQQQVQTIQAGKTWVTINAYGNAAIEPGVILNQDGSSVQNFYYQLAAPDFSAYPPPISFYGTNFLNVWAGGGGNLAGSTNGVFLLPSGMPSLGNDAAYAFSKSSLIAAYPFFCNYAAFLFHFDDTWATAGQTQFIPLTLANEESIVSVIGSSDTLNQLVTESQQYESALYDLFKSDLSGDPTNFNINHPGGTSKIDYDYLMSLIASYFNFDPNTGAELATFG